MIGYLFHEDYLCATWRELETVYAGLVVGQLPAVCSIGIHRPDLSSGNEGDAFATLYPCWISLASRSCSELTDVLAVGIHDADYLATLVLFHTVVAHLVYDELSVG